VHLWLQALRGERANRIFQTLHWPTQWQAARLQTWVKHQNYNESEDDKTSEFWLLSLRDQVTRVNFLLNSQIRTVATLEPPNQINEVVFEVFTAVTMKNVVIWDNFFSLSLY
jgi:hypothetical protein